MASSSGEEYSDGRITPTSKRRGLLTKNSSTLLLASLSREAFIDPFRDIVLPSDSMFPPKTTLKKLTKQKSRSTENIYVSQKSVQCLPIHTLSAQVSHRKRSDPLSEKYHPSPDLSASFHSTQRKSELSAPTFLRCNSANDILVRKRDDDRKASDPGLGQRRLPKAHASYGSLEAHFTSKGNTHSKSAHENKRRHHTKSNDNTSRSNDAEPPSVLPLETKEPPAIEITSIDSPVSATGPATRKCLYPDDTQPKTLSPCREEGSVCTDCQQVECECDFGLTFEVAKSSMPQCYPVPDQHIATLLLTNASTLLLTFDHLMWVDNIIFSNFLFLYVLIYHW